METNNLNRALLCFMAVLCVVRSADDSEILVKDSSEIQPRFLPPFSASFSLGVGGNAAQSFSVSGGPGGIGLSQSSSLTDGAGGGKPGFSSSQSSSLAAGLNGISAADSSAFSSNHPLYGQNSQANGNAFALGQASATAHGDVVNGLATSGAQSSTGSTHTQASSGAQSQHFTQHAQRPANYQQGWNYPQPTYGNGYGGDYYYNKNRQPKLTITVNDNNGGGRYRPPSGGWYEVQDDYSWRQPDCRNYQSWYRDPRCRGARVTINKPGYRPVGSYRPYYQNIRDPRENSLQVASASSGAQVRPGGLTISHAMSQSQGPATLTISQAEAQASVSPQVGLTSSSATANSQATSASSSSKGQATAHASASSGSLVTFPGPSSGPSSHQIVPEEFIRSTKSGKKKKDKDTLDEILDDLTDTVYDIFDD